MHYPGHNVDWDSMSTHEKEKQINKLRKEKLYNDAISYSFQSYGIADKIYTGVELKNKAIKAEWMMDDKNIVQNGVIKPLFVDRPPTHEDGFLNNIILNKVKNANRDFTQRIAIRKNVLRDDFVNYWADNMINHENPVIAKAFKDTFGNTVIEGNLKKGSFSMQDVVNFYEGKEYKNLVSQGISEGGTGLTPWMKDVSNFSYGDNKGLKGYINKLGDDMNLSLEDMHYIVQRDGGYAVLPNVDASVSIDPNLKGSLNLDEELSMNPRTWNNLNNANINKYKKDAIEGISVGDDGTFNVSDKFFGSDEYYNLAPQFQKELKNINATGANVSTWQQGVSQPGNISSSSLQPVPSLPSGNTAPKLSYTKNIAKNYADKNLLGKASTAVSVLSSGATLLDEDSDDVEKGLAAASLAAEGAAVGAFGTAASSTAWIPYVGPLLAIAGTVYSATKDSGSSNSGNQTQQKNIDDDLDKIYERNRVV